MVPIPFSLSASPSHFWLTAYFSHTTYHRLHTLLVIFQVVSHLLSSSLVLAISIQLRIVQFDSDETCVESIQHFFAMADSARFSFLLLFLTLCPLLNLVVSADSPHISPSLSPHSDADSPPPVAPTPDVKDPIHAPVSSPSVSSPPEPRPVAPDPGSSTPSKTADSITAGNSSGGMSAGRKAGIVIGVIAAACVIGLAGIIYRKRQHNIRRSQFGYVARSEIL